MTPTPTKKTSPHAASTRKTPGKTTKNEATKKRVSNRRAANTMGVEKLRAKANPVEDGATRLVSPTSHPASSVSSPGSAASSGSGASSGTGGGAHRLRQASVSVILDRVFGPLGECDPDLWDRRAYLLLVGSAYERMAGSDDITTDELVKLARVLAETRRSKAAAPTVDSMKPSATTRHLENNRLPDRFGEMVRDLYGTSLPTENVDEKTNSA